MLMDAGKRVVEVRSVADPRVTLHQVEYRGYTLRILGDYGLMQVDKAWDSQGKEIDPASLGQLELRVYR